MQSVPDRQEDIENRNHEGAFHELPRGKTAKIMQEDSVDIEKIRMMARLSLFEKREGKEIREISRYYKGDYVSAQILKAILHYSLCFILLLGTALLIQLETLLLNLNFAFLGEAMKLVLLLYGMGLLLTMLMAGFGAAGHYDHSYEMGERYAEYLEQLLSYEESGNAVKYAKEEASSYMRQYVNTEPEGGWLDEDEDTQIDVVNIAKRGK